MTGLNKYNKVETTKKESKQSIKHITKLPLADGLKSAPELGTLMLRKTAPMYYKLYLSILIQKRQCFLTASGNFVIGFLYQELEQLVKPEFVSTDFFVHPIMPTFQVGVKRWPGSFLLHLLFHFLSGIEIAHERQITVHPHTKVDLEKMIHHSYERIYLRIKHFDVVHMSCTQRSARVQKSSNRMHRAIWWNGHRSIVVMKTSNFTVLQLFSLYISNTGSFLPW
ncbi:hypothetical protein Tsp_00824 [Trichinella spiralis]|uniref:hypothetical protein n=1 Tax=Trichinella spiralis TaxID=6334 RepID=UPI0001EFD03C|nr:hypothetical protein Tsp_00824 [Trichinella spiralis]